MSIKSWRMKVLCVLWKTLLRLPGVGAWKRIMRDFNVRPWRDIFTTQYLNVIQQLKLVNLDGVALPPLCRGEFRWSCGATKSINMELSVCGGGGQVRLLVYIWWRSQKQSNRHAALWTTSLTPTLTLTDQHASQLYPSLVREVVSEREKEGKNSCFSSSVRLAHWRKIEGHFFFYSITGSFQC